MPRTTLVDGITDERIFRRVASRNRAGVAAKREIRTMLRLVLIRPGATDFDVQGRIQGTLDIPLNAQGKLESAQVAAAVLPLGVRLVYSSPCESARQAAEVLVSALGVKVKKLPSMRNLDHGLLQGNLVSEVKRNHPRLYRHWQERPESVCLPEGELLADAQQRVGDALAKLIRKHKDDTIALVVPEPLATLVASHLRGAELGDLWKAHAEHGTWELIEVDRPSVAKVR